MKIALCDDAGNDRAAMERRILQLYPGAKIEQFENGFVLLDFLERNSRNCFCQGKSVAKTNEIL